ncbi:hypothetical protein [Mycolicibacterium setense]
MTQPDGFLPGSAFNWDSLAEIAARPQAEWEAIMRGQTSSGFETFIAAMFGPLPADLREGIEFTRALVTAIIRQILNLPGQIWDSVEDALTALSSWVISIPADVQAAINAALGDVQDALNGTYAGSDPVLLAVKALAEAWLKVTDPLNPANIIGRLRSWQMGAPSLSMIITDSPNLFAEFISAASVPNVDGWSFDAANNAAQVVLDGTTKAIYDDPVDVAPGQELDASISALLSSVTSTPGAAVQLALLTYDGVSETPTGTVVLASIANPSGTATWATLSGSYTVPVSGVKAVAPTLKVVGGTSGTVKFKTPAGELVLPDSLQGGLRTIFETLRDIFDGVQEEVPSNPVLDVIKGWRDFFFGGGPQNVVTQNQIAEPTGVPPTDANNKVPWIYLPPELTAAAVGHPWVELTKVGSQTISSNTVTRLTAFSRAGGFPLTDTSSVFAVPFAGLFHVTVRATWANTPETTMRVILYKNGSQYRMDNRFGDPLGSVLGYNEVSEYVPLDAGDTIEFRVFWLGSGSTKDISVTNTYARITYIGATHLASTPIPAPTVTFDAKGTADNGAGDAAWNHTFGANAKTIVIPFSHEAPEMPTISCGPHNVPILSGPTHIGNYFGFNARYSLAAAILPDAVKGTTQAISVDFPSGNAAFSGNSLSFNDVAYLGAVRVSSGSSGPAKLMVPSNAFSQVAGGFGGMDSNFSGFNRTQDNIWNFVAGNTWAHVMGHAQGGLEFTASGGDWAGKFVELHP